MFAYLGLDDDGEGAERGSGSYRGGRGAFLRSNNITRAPGLDRDYNSNDSRGASGATELNLTEFIRESVEMDTRRMISSRGGGAAGSVGSTRAPLPYQGPGRGYAAGRGAPGGGRGGRYY